MHTKDDVGPRFVNGIAVDLEDEEKQAIADEWNANEAEVAKERDRVDLEAKRRAALAALEENRLEAALADPAAPEAVREYAAALAAKGRIR